MNPNTADVLAGGGEMGALMRDFDWGKTPIGSVDSWPQSLRTALGLLLDSRYPMYIAWGPNFTQLYNDAYRPILGSKKHPAALGESTRVTFSEIWEFIGPMFERVMAGGDPTFLEDQILPLDRHDYVEECYFTFCYSAIRSEAGGVGGVFVTVTETTGRVLGERRLRVLRDLGAAAGEVTSPDEACAAAARVLASNPEDLPFALVYLFDEKAGVARLAASSGLGLDHVAAPQIHALTENDPWQIATVAESGNAVHVVDLERRFGTVDCGPWPETPTEAVILPMAGQEKPIGVLIAGISARRTLDAEYRSFLNLVAGQIGTAVANARAREEERRRAEALAELDRAKTAFFSNVSHEFRTPLTLMLGPLEELLASPDLQTSHRVSALAAHRNAVRQLRLVNTLLDFSRIEAGRIQASYAPTDVATLTADLASAFRSAVEKAGLTLELELSPLREPLYVDADMWEKIVLNLLSNAFKHTFEGSITVSLREVDDAAELRVSDSGVGIAPDDLPLVFTRFHRVKGARARSHEGTGIGLSLVRELVRLHGGEISAESELGAGTSFIVRVPFGTSHLPEDSIGKARSAATPTLSATSFVEDALRWLPDPDNEPVTRDEAVPSRVLPLGAQSARVLIADDNLDLREYLTRLLKPYWSIETVGDGAAALAAARRTPPDLILADVMMPGLDGFELLRALRSDPVTRDIPVVLLSARAGEEASVEGLGAGADDYIVKPFSARELIARISARLELARLRRTAASEGERFIRELSREREQLSEIFKIAPAFMAVLRGPDHVFERSNPRYDALLPGRPLIGRTVREVIPELEGQGYYEWLDEAFRSGEPFIGNEILALLEHPGGVNQHYLNFVYQPLRDVDGNVNGLFVHGVDVTELVRARKAAEDANQVKTDFMATMSHELRTPLNAIIGYVDLLRLGVPDTLPAGSLTYVERVGASARHLLQLIEEVLAFTRLQAGSFTTEVGPVDVKELIEEVCAVVEPLANQKQLPFTVNAAGAPASFATDARKLRQILMNLLGNAVKFTDSGDVRMDITTETDALHFRVVDTGIGISADQLASVFEPFWQGDQSRTRQWGGTGLGLAISQRLAHLIGGDITVESKPGEGSTFTLRLPNPTA